jgi:pectinesterase
MTSIVCRASLAALALAMLPVAASAQGPAASFSYDVRVENPLPIAREHETIALSWEMLRQQYRRVDASRVRVIDAAGVEVVSQVLDADADGTPDSLLFQTSLWPNETKSFRILNEPAKVVKPRVHVKFVPERTDIAWENDRIAFRTYGQLLWQLENLHSSGVDVWVKRTRELVLDKWYAGGHDFYHLDRGEGADFYKVGPTLGAGATAIWRNDRLYRAENFRTHRIVANGPIRAIFELDFDPWDAGGVRVTESKRIAIDAGQNVYRQESVFRADGQDSVTYAVGFVKRPGLVGSTSRARAWAWLSGWGPVENKYGEGGHGDLGTAALVDRARVLDVKETSDHYVLVAKAPVGRRVVHYLGAGWTGSRDFDDAEAWWACLDAWAQRLTTPVKVTLTGSGR